MKPRRAQRPADPAQVLPAIYDALYEAWGPQGWWPGETPFEVMVGAILTQNCAWTNVVKAIASLKRERMLEPRALHEASHERVAELIRPTGYFNVKARRLKSFLAWFMREAGGDEKSLRAIPTPVLRERLLSVNGLGRETADSILLYALGRRIFVIDAYTRRILKRHRVIAGDEPYDDLRAMFEAHMPKRRKLYNEYHGLIVNAGKDHCRPAARCAGCPLARFQHDESL
ncbi:MAG: endonuclease III domain-containing protein [Planctomycetota bacterium]|nr:endonuclease III domain-containing protein [Planctomycetota bacterium]